MPPRGHYATGICFLDHDESIRSDSIKQFEAQASNLGLQIIAWRQVPSDPTCLGKVARDCEPYMLQVFVKGEVYSKITFFMEKSPSKEIFSISQNCVFTSVLCHLFLHTPDSCNFSNFTWNHAKVDKFFYSKSRKTRKIIFHQFHVSHKWLEVKSRSHFTEILHITYHYPILQTWEA